MSKKYKLILLMLIGINLYSQDCREYKINKSLIEAKTTNSSIQAGSCASPNGSMNPVTSPPPDYAWLLANGYCYAITPSKNFSVCYTFTSTGTAINLNSGYSSTGCGSISFSGFNLYTCSPGCVLVGTGLSFTGLTPGQCYTWCYSGNCGGPGPGFSNICPYWQNVTVLPIELLSFDCYPKDRGIELQWTTSNEFNCKYYVIQKSLNAKVFEDLGYAPCYNTLKTHSYAFLDTLIDNGALLYYRLKQVDYNGSYKFYPIIDCYISKSDNEVIEYFNLLGQQIDYEPINRVYIKKVINGNNIKYTKMIKYDL